MNLDEAQQILKENGLLLESTLNTKSIDDKIEGLKKVKTNLTNLSDKVDSILSRLGYTSKHRIYDAGSYWKLITEFDEGSFEFYLKGYIVDIFWSFKDYGYGESSCDIKDLDVFIIRLLRKKNLKVDEDEL
jgi:hypothetical protein